MVAIVFFCGCARQKISGIPNPDYMRPTQELLTQEVTHEKVRQDILRHINVAGGAPASYEVVPWTQPLILAYVSEQQYKRGWSQDAADESKARMFRQYTKDKLCFYIQIVANHPDEAEFDYLNAKVSDVAGVEYPVKFKEKSGVQKRERTEYSNTGGYYLGKTWVPGNTYSYQVVDYTANCVACCEASMDLTEPFSLTILSRAHKKNKPFTLQWNQ